MTSSVLVLVLIPVLVLLLLARPKLIFLFLVGGLLNYYVPFLQNELVLVGNAKVYFGDLVLISLGLFLTIRFFWKGRIRLKVKKSWFFFLLFFVWGLAAIARGIPGYGYSAPGEARGYVLPILYYFFVVSLYVQQDEVTRLLKWLSALVLIMLVAHFVQFYFLGGIREIAPDIVDDPRSIFRFINSTESLAVAFVLIAFLLFSMAGEIPLLPPARYATIGILALILIVVQDRSVWMALATGLVGVGVAYRKRFLHLTGFFATLGIAILLLLPLAGSLIGRDMMGSLSKSATFLTDPLRDMTTPWRIAGWSQELQKAMENPIAGRGLGGYSEWFDGNQWQRVAVHNGYIMYFSKFGIVGLSLLFLGLWFWFAEMARYQRAQSDPRAKLLAYALEVLILMHAVYALFYDFTIFFWILLALGTVLTKGAQARWIPGRFPILQNEPRDLAYAVR